MDKIIEYSNYARIHFDIIHRLGSLLLMTTLTNEKISSSYESIEWYDKEDSKRNNKDRMKELVRILSGYQKNLTDLSIIGISKTIEDLLFDLKDTFRINLNFWTDCKEYRFFNEMKIIRNLNNCIKHSKGIIKRGEKSNNFLIDNANFPEDSSIDKLDIDIDNFLIQSFIFQMDIFWKTKGEENHYLKYENDYQKIRELLIPDFINNRAQQKI